jgi:hypothetical protein
MSERDMEQLHRATVAALVDLAQAMKAAEESGDDDAIESAERAIQEDPLSVMVRDGWRVPGSESGSAEEFEILLSTGGPASRIRGTLDSYGEPDTFHVEVQDWFKPWQSFCGMTGKEGDLIRNYYLSRFYFGD